MAEYARDFHNVSRIEVIDSTGRAFTRYYAAHTALVQVQDGGRTLKIFAEAPVDPEVPHDF